MKPATVYDCIGLASHVYEVPPLDLLLHRRGAKVVEARQVCYWLARHTTLASLPSIGQKLGGRDHSTVSYGIRKIDGRREKDPKFKERLDTMVSWLMGEDSDD